MTFTVESKSQLAKLMATENLTIQHQKIQTAKFDPTNRVLYLPVWQNMTGVMYDLLTGHEVGHARWTPAEGWHNVASDKTKGKYYKNFLNVVEDARIEKKIQRKYPGLRLSFRDAYAELNKRDFFGIGNRDINKLAFIERLNLYTKSQYTSKIDFSPEESKFIERIQKLESWDDVIALTDEIYAYSKDEQFDKSMEEFQKYKQDLFDNYNLEDDYDLDGDDYDSEDYDDGDEQENGNQNNQDDYDSKNEGSSSKGDLNEGDDSEESEESSNTEFNRYKESAPSKDTFEPKCETDESFRNNESMLLDESCKEYVYVNVPTPNYKQIITPAKRVQGLLSEFYQDRVKEMYLTEAAIKEAVSDFKTKNDRYISLLAKEFEMRKAAKSYSKSKISDTGDIDINKLSTYKFDDNIFRKMMIVPKGKSHGLILLLDRSGSMHENMAGSIEQILVLSMFCRKVNIPFIVYGFGDCTTSKHIDMNTSNTGERLLPCFSSNLGELAFRELYLREYLNSKMSNAEFSKSIRNMILLKKSYEDRGWSRFGRPDCENLSNTPMIQAVYAVGGIMKEFRKQNNLDLSSLVIVHDGDADNCSSYIVEQESKNYRTGEPEKRLVWNGMNFRSTNFVLVDNKTKFQKLIKVDEHKSYGELLSDAMFEWFRHTTDSKVFGFFLVPTYRRGSLKNCVFNRFVTSDNKTMEQLRKENYCQSENVLSEAVKELRTEKFLLSHDKKYNSFYLVVGGSELQTENEEIEIDGKVTSSKLKNAFMKFNKKKAVNRVLVSKFIQGIAA